MVFDFALSLKFHEWFDDHGKIPAVTKFLELLKNMGAYGCIASTALGEDLACGERWANDIAIPSLPAPWQYFLDDFLDPNESNERISALYDEWLLPARRCPFAHSADATQYR